MPQAVERQVLWQPGFLHSAFEDPVFRRLVSRGLPRLVVNTKSTFDCQRSPSVAFISSCFTCALQSRISILSGSDTFRTLCFVLGLFVFQPPPSGR